MNKMETDSDAENRLTVVRSEWVGGLVEKREAIKQEKKNHFLATNNSMVVIRGKGEQGEVEESEGRIHGDRGRLDFGW